MLIRCAFFKGTILQEYEESFHTHWQENLVPLWSAFPHLIELRVMREVESDNSENPFPLVMAMKFNSKEDIKEALNSPTRWKSKEVSKKLLGMLNGSVIHTVFDTKQFSPIFD